MVTAGVPELIGLLGLGVGAGVLGALVGIGGGVVIVPALLLVFGFDPRVAVATSLLAVVGTSVAAGALGRGGGLANQRIGLSLELATIVGGISGGLIATAIAPQLIGALLGVLLGVTAVLLLRGRDDHGARGEAGEAQVAGDPELEEDEATQLAGHLAGTYRDGHSGRRVAYRARRLPVVSAIAFGAGALSGLLGVGGGFLKVPAMNMVMGLPLKVAAATSSFMVGLTALASLFIYVNRGFFYPYLAAPVVVGVLVGGVSGARLQHRASPVVLRIVLAGVLALVAVQLLLQAVG